jgi:hypothetical protein
MDPPAGGAVETQNPVPTSLYPTSLAEARTTALQNAKQDDKWSKRAGGCCSQCFLWLVSASEVTWQAAPPIVD